MRLQAFNEGQAFDNCSSSGSARRPVQTNDACRHPDVEWVVSSVGALHEDPDDPTVRA
jgi:hypothetical protein